MQPQVLALFPSLSICVTVRYAPVPALGVLLVFLTEVQMALGSVSLISMLCGRVCRPHHSSHCCESPVSDVVTGCGLCFSMKISH